MLRLLQIGTLTLAALGACNVSQAAVLLSFGSSPTYTWDQANVPNKGIQLGVDDATTRSGASFGPTQINTNLTRTNDLTGFVDAQAGVNLNVGYLSRITKRRNGDMTPNAPLETTGTKAVNIPQDKNVSGGDIGTAIIRRGIQVGWAALTSGFAIPVMVNNPGADIVIWESGNANQPDAMMVRVRNAATQAFTDWFYYTPTEQPTVTGGSVLFAYAYDFSNFGMANGVQIDLIEMANMVSTDRIDGPGISTTNGFVAQGHVRPEAGGAFTLSNPGPDPGNSSAYLSPFGGGTYDPDPLYVSVLSNLQNFTAAPEPASLIGWSLIIGFGAIGAVVRRSCEKK